jgi:hypothetical protein
MESKEGREMTTPDVTERAMTIVQAAQVLQIKTKDDYVQAAGLWKDLTAMGKEIKEAFNGIIEKAHAAHKEAIAQRDKYLDPVDKATKQVKSLMLSYDAEQDRLRRAEEARLAELARKAEEEARLAEALALEANGQKAEAEAVLSEQVQAPVMIIKKDTPKVEGGPVFRTVWKFRITDAAKLPREYLAPDEVKIGQVIRALKNMTNIPGVQAYEERV